MNKPENIAQLAGLLSTLNFQNMHPEEAKKWLETYARPLFEPDTIPKMSEVIEEGMDVLCFAAHESSTNAGWWNCPVTGEDLLSNESYAPYVLATKMMLMVSETAEAMEGLRKDLMDDKLPQYSMEGCELADIMIRVADYAGKREIPLGEIIVAKMDFNTTRPDHQMDNRRKLGGKKF